MLAVTIDEVKLSALEGIRTPNLLIRSQMLYPLSYKRRLLGESYLLAPDAPNREKGLDNLKNKA